MKTAFIVCLMVAGLMLPAFAGVPPQSAVADNSEPSGAILAVESGQLEALFAQGNPGESDNNDVTSKWTELMRIAKEYRAASKPEAKDRLSQRADYLMGQLFDLKVGVIKKRIDALELRLKTERDRLKDMQTHKLDLVHTAMQKLMNSGGQEMPDWATPAPQQR